MVKEMYKLIRCECGQFIVVKTDKKYVKCPRCKKELAVQRYLVYEISYDKEYLKKLADFLKRHAIRK